MSAAPNRAFPDALIKRIYGADGLALYDGIDWSRWRPLDARIMQGGDYYLSDSGDRGEIRRCIGSATPPLFPRIIVGPINPRRWVFEEILPTQPPQRIGDLYYNPVSGEISQYPVVDAGSVDEYIAVRLVESPE